MNRPLNFGAVHEQACQLGQDTYLDPATGYTVMTRLALLKQGNCCGNACRHCPYGHLHVQEGPWQKAIQSEPVVLHGAVLDIPEVDVLFWSGGKDSLLSWMQLQAEQRPVVLLTTFDPHSRRVPIQNIPVSLIAQQARWLNLPLCLVPVGSHSSHVRDVKLGLQEIERVTHSFVGRLVFGDLHLRDIRQWRVEQFAGYPVYTPLFDQPYSDLLPRLWAQQSRTPFDLLLSCALNSEALSLSEGTPYTPELVQRLEQAGLDPMLEQGEAHTVVIPRA